MITLLAVLKAKPGQTDALRKVLQGLLLPTRQEPGNLDYALFQLRDAPDTFYMRESWRDQQALVRADQHVAFRQALAERADRHQDRLQVRQRGEGSLDGIRQRPFITTH